MRPKRKTAHKRDDAVRGASIKTPKDLLSTNQDALPSIDGLMVNDLQLLTRIAHNAHCQTASYLSSAQNEDIINKANKEVDAFVGGILPPKKRAAIKNLRR